MSDSPTSKKSTRSARPEPSGDQEAEKKNTPSEQSSEPSKNSDDSETRSGPVTKVRDARTNPPADSDDSSPEENNSRRADDARKEKNHTPDEIPATIEDGSDNSDSSDKDDKDDNSRGGNNRRKRSNRDRRGGKKPREDREPQSGQEVDQDRLSDMAWKIYKSEVCEEGLALLDPRSMREYARSSFRAARVFLEEEHDQS